MKGCQIMIHNSYFAFIYNPIRYCYNIIGDPTHVGADSWMFGEKNPFDQLFAKVSWHYFLWRCLSKFDHGKILEIQVPLSKSVHCPTCCELLLIFDKIFPLIMGFIVFLIRLQRLTFYSWLMVKDWSERLASLFWTDTFKIKEDNTYQTLNCLTLKGRQ